MSGKQAKKARKATVTKKRLDEDAAKMDAVAFATYLWRIGTAAAESSEVAAEFRVTKHGAMIERILAGAISESDGTEFGVYSTLVSSASACVEGRSPAERAKLIETVRDYCLKAEATAVVA